MNRTALKEVIRDRNGNPIHYSRNLRGILTYSRNRLITVVEVFQTNQNTSAGYPHSNGRLRVVFDNGANYTTDFASFNVLCVWVSNRRNWYGAPLNIDGDKPAQPSGHT